MTTRRPESDMKTALSDHLFVLELADVFPAVSELSGEDLLGMLAELRRRRPQRARRLRQLERHADHIDLPERRMIEGDDVIVRLHLRIVGKIVHALDRGKDEIAGAAKNLEPFGERLLLERGRDA